MADLGKPLVVRLVAAAVALVLVVAVAYLFTRGGDEGAEVTVPEVGDCLVMSGTLKAAQHEEVDCADVAAAYKVASDDGKCDRAEASYEISTGAGNEGAVDLCLDLNVAEGDCLTETSVGAFTTKVACDEVKEDRKAQKVVFVGTADDQCVTGAQPLRNATRDTLLCLGPTT